MFSHLFSAKLQKEETRIGKNSNEMKEKSKARGIMCLGACTRLKRQSCPLKLASSYPTPPLLWISLNIYKKDTEMPVAGPSNMGELIEI
jgi:hypothetical protein